MSTESFEFVGHPYRIVFGPGSLSRVADEVRHLGRSRALLLSMPDVAVHGDRVAEALGTMCVGRFDGAAMHTPVAVTEQALDLLNAYDADCVVAVGGGSTTGLAKALAVRTGVSQVVLPTTYAGSEVTPVLGETANGRKTTRSAAEILPDTVVYDVELSRDLPVAMTVTSAVNALAHAVEALYSAQANPVVDGLALDAVSHLADGLRRLPADPRDLEVRSSLLRGAWLAGTCLASVGMGLHHKLCHVLGGTFDVPHAPTHTVVLPHAMAYNASSARTAMERVAAALGATDAPSAVFDLVTGAGGPTALRDLGLPESDLDRAAAEAASMTYPNPAAVTAGGLRGLLADAWRGAPPAPTV